MTSSFVRVWLLMRRNIGLAAHDFQQAMTAREVWVTRSTKLDDALQGFDTGQVGNMVLGMEDTAALRRFERARRRARRAFLRRVRRTGG